MVAFVWQGELADLNEIRLVLLKSSSDVVLL